MIRPRRRAVWASQGVIQEHTEAKVVSAVEVIVKHRDEVDLLYLPWHDDVGEVETVVNFVRARQAEPAIDSVQAHAGAATGRLASEMDEFARPVEERVV